ncbi:GNAT family N-acetyltransferase [Enterococcus columbae]|uniref:N-acetyltransferase domain-containing protein n=1 Tax=Enterococcus columbae DSM 7374 = ATCC 51263 TaxID=1121865 RepID=S0KIV7_9ENTE|nr:GNAT family N-acetyltransferase [Enterococcus columbae]EOT44647.1 hypothetical protein OMW_00703 [Enterococcus columbae DSM 7374 = ATCC 51263]EOW87457.1 hypothetical protein I568_00501 [Enterococcus columbae DSM 7374 = ATCC 51263]OJG25114.1 hypothetical protein RR47_GL001902 [Enterococcus columbae DSM 7374 = ATCC 51263]
MHKCVEADREKVTDYLYRNPALNLFIIGDLYNYGFDSEVQDIYIDEDETGIHGLILRYRNSLLVQSDEGRTYPEFVAELVERHQVTHINGEASLVAKYDFTARENVLCYFSQCKELKKAPEMTAVESFGPEDAQEISEVFKSAFKNFSANPDEIQESLAKKLDRVYGVRVDGKIVSIARSTAECPGLAMLVGVATLAPFRNHGYAQQTVAKLTADLLVEGKAPCLFYENPIAARIYERLGYNRVGKWRIVRL